MSSISSLGKRVSDSLVYQQLNQQLQTQQSALEKIEQQVSSGNALSVPSDNPTAALQGIGLQSLVQRLTQYQSDLNTSQAFLNQTGSALSNAATILSNAQGTALSAVGNTQTAAEQSATLDTISSDISSLLQIANQQFDGQYLFSGSATNTQPFLQTAAGISYQGNNNQLQTYSDTNNLFPMNVSGNEAFGATSSGVVGTANLTPALSASTPLSELNGGQGLTLGSVSISDGSSTSIVNLSSARTLGDVAQLLAANPPAGRTISAHVGSTGLVVQLGGPGGGSLSIGEANGGNSAALLGINNVGGAPTQTIDGATLTPQLGLTTPLSSLLGSPAVGYLTASAGSGNIVIQSNGNGTTMNGVTVNLINSAKLQAGAGLAAGQETAVYNAHATPATASLVLPGASNDLILTADTAGTAYNNVSVNVVNGGNIGNTATAAYDASTKTLTLTVDGSNQTTTDTLMSAIDSSTPFTAARDPSAEPNASGGVVLASSVGTNVANTLNTGGEANTLDVYIDSGQSSANDVIAAINADTPLVASLDTSEPNNNGDGVIEDSATDPAATAVLSGGTGTTLDPSGLQITNGGKTYDISLAGVTTVQGLLNAINGSGAHMVASINSQATGINVQSVLSGSTFSIGENGGTTATELGIRTFTTSTPLASLNSGQGVPTTGSTDFTITRKDGVQLNINLTGATTIGDVLNLINNNATNLASGVPVVAQLTSQGNGIQLVDNDPQSTGSLTVTDASSSTAAVALGLVPSTSTTSTPPTAGTPATDTITFPGANNDLLITGKTGTGLNGVSVQFENTGAGPSVTYDATAKTLTFDVDPATTTANQITGLVAADPTASAAFNVTLAPTDASNDGTGTLGTLPANSTLSGATAETLTGTDTNPGQVTSAFTALLNLYTAVQNNNPQGIQAAVNVLNQATTTLDEAQADVGLRLQNIGSLQTSQQTESTNLQSAESNFLDTDLTSAITNMMSTQTAFQASLQLTGMLSKLTLFNYL